MEYETGGVDGKEQSCAKNGGCVHKGKSTDVIIMIEFWNDNYYGDNGNFDDDDEVIKITYKYYEFGNSLLKLGCNMQCLLPNSPGSGICWS